MKKRANTVILSMTIAFLLGMASAHGQEKRVNKAQVNGRRDAQAQFYRRTLRIDSAKASAVAGIQSDYKHGMAVTVADSGMTDVQKQARIRELMEAKNAKLEKILSPAQQDKVIPTTERSGHRGAGEPKEKHEPIQAR